MLAHVQRQRENVKLRVVQRLQLCKSVSRLMRCDMNLDAASDTYPQACEGASSDT